MIELVVDNVFVEVKYASNDIEFQIWEKLAFEIKEYNPTVLPQIRHLFNRKTKKSYTGLLDYIIEILDNNNEKYIIVDKRKAWEPNADYSLVKYLDEERTQELKVRDYQQRIIDNCRPREIIHAATSSGKALPLDTLILTSNGWKELRNIHPGDIIYDENGKETKVLQEFFQGEKDVYEITFEDNTKIECCEDHLWKVYDKKWRVLSTKEILNNKNLYIPLNKPIKFKKKKLELHPYIVGVIINNGNWYMSDENVVRTNLKPEVFEKINNLLIGNLFDFVESSQKLINYYNLNSEEVIKKYLYSSIKDRQELLQGIIDVNKNKYTFLYKNKETKNIVEFLLYSLGYRFKIKRNTYFDLQDQHLFTDTKLKIRKIKKLNIRKEMKCITVDSPKHTFICQDFIVTHNTFMMAALIAKFNVKPVSIFADKISLCTQLRNEFHRFLGEPIGLVGGGIKDVQDITVFSTQSATEELVKDTKFMLVDECFTRDTLIQLKDNQQVKIGEIQEKNVQFVLSFNIEKNIIEEKRILNFYKIPLKKQLVLVVIQVNNKMIRITCTVDHKFYIINKGYIQIQNAIKNDQVYVIHNNQLIIGFIFQIITLFKNDKFVYDIEVEDNHNFFANSILVHNCHHLPCDSLSVIGRWCKDAYYRVGVSATPWRSDNSDLLIDAVCNRQRPEMKVTASELIQQGFITPCIIYWIKQPAVQTSRIYNYAYKDAITMNVDRNLKIIKIAYQMHKIKDSTVLILVQFVEHGEILLNLLQQYITNESFMVEASTLSGKLSSARVNEIEFLSGTDAALKRNAVLQAVREKKCKILLATTIFDEGLDVPSIDTVILAGAGRSSTRALQRIGRALRKYPGKDHACIFDFKDQTPMFLRQARARQQLYSTETEFKIQNLPPELLNFKLKLLDLNDARE